MSRRWIRRTRSTGLLAAVAVAALAGAPDALADTAQSSNWAGYAVHGGGVHFTRVAGTWSQPRATCTSGQATYSSVWVGLGGYALSSPALEQIGTDSDCTASGRAVSSAWFELVPSASRAIKMTVNAGDRMRAGVTVKGGEVTVTLADLTRRTSFTKRLHPTTVDTTSAEWILEAPSVCSDSSASSCHILPLANFGSAGFTAAAATTSTGHRGTIEDRNWRATRISLAAGGRAFVSEPPASSVGAVPSTLSSHGSAFTVSYRGGATSTAPTTIQTAFVAGDRLTHPPNTHLERTMIIATSASPHLFWITSRAAGIVSLVLASLAVSAGLVMSLRMMRARRPELLVLHEVLSLGTLVALAVHGVSLLGDHFLSPTLADIALPFAWSYKTLWTSIGIIGGWALVFLGLSYYARHAIGASRWRTLHRFTAVAWIAGIVHTLGEGTDAGQIWFLAMLALVAVPAVLLLAVRHLTEETPRQAPPGDGLQPRRVADHEARELPAASRPAGPALG